MTDKTVTMSRDLAQKLDDLLYIMTGHDSHPRLIRKYGEEWWAPLDAMRAEICTTLAVPVVERQPVAAAWLKVTDKGRGNEYELDWYGAAERLTAGEYELYTSPPELAELQATIARLTAEKEALKINLEMSVEGAASLAETGDEEVAALKSEIERLKGGQGEPVGRVVEFGRGLREISWAKGKLPDLGVELYTSPHAPVAVVIPDVDVLAQIIRTVDGNHSLGAGALAERIIDKVKELNQ
jgi:hypothetical protein